MKSTTLIVIALLTVAFGLPGHSFAATGQDWGVDDTKGISMENAVGGSGLLQNLAVVSSGMNAGLYMVGRTGGGTVAAFERRNLADGSLALYQAPYSSSNIAGVEAVTVDDTGVYTAGVIGSGSSAPAYLIVQKRDSSGNIIWSQTVRGVPVDMALVGSELVVLSFNYNGSNSSELIVFNPSTGSNYVKSTWNPTEFYSGPGVAYFWPGFVLSDPAETYLYHSQDFTAFKSDQSWSTLWSSSLSSIKNFISISGGYTNWSIFAYLNSTSLVFTNTPQGGNGTCSGSSCFVEEANLSTGAVTSLPVNPYILAIDDSNEYSRTVSGGNVYVKKISLSSNQVVSTTDVISPVVTTFVGSTPTYTIGYGAMGSNGTMYTRGYHYNSSNLNWPAHFMNIGFIDSISPATGSTGGGTTVTITGTNFTGTTAVSFGGVAAKSFTVNSPTQITAVAPAGSAGTVPINVVNALDTKSINYTYVQNCTNGATNPPTCDTCPTNEGWDTSTNSCVACSNGGCAGTGGSSSNPTGGLVCNNAALNPLTCNVFAPTATLSANSTTINIGSSVKLSWSSSNTTSCSGSGFSTGGATTGSATVSPTQTTSYGITCTGAGGSVSKAVTVTVQNPNVSISVSPTRVRSGNTSTITWSSTNVKNCSLTAPDGTVLSTATSGNQQVTVVSDSTYTLSCVDQATGTKTVTGEATVTTVPAYTQF